MDFSRYVWLAVVALFALESTPSSAQGTLVLANIGYENSGFVAPAVLMVRATRSNDSRWTIGLVGTNLLAEWERIANPRWSTLVRGDVVWRNANMSDFIYTRGLRDESREYRNRTVRLTGAVRFRPSTRWTAEVRAIGLYEFVDEIANTAVSELWDAPYAGLGVALAYRHVLSDDVLQFRWDGLKASTETTVFVGPETWVKSQTWIGVGTRAGPVFFHGSGWLLLGRNLNIVTRHLVGGSWDLAPRPILYGYHFGEFRLDRALVANGGMDVRLAGAWEIGIRAGYLSSPSETTYGEAIRLGSVWQGVAFYGGLGFPEGVGNDAVGFVWMSLALLQ